MPEGSLAYQPIWHVAGFDEVVLKEHMDELTREQRMFFIEKFPLETLETLSGRATSEEVDLCSQLHPSIALGVAPDGISDERLGRLAATHSFDVLLHASHRLSRVQLLHLTAVHPGECIVILERHPESGLRKSLRPLHDGLSPNVVRALEVVLNPGG